MIKKIYCIVALLPFLFLNSCINTDSAELGRIIVSQGALTPVFSSDVLNYKDTVPTSVSSMTVTPVGIDLKPKIEVKINSGVFSPVVSGQPSENLPLNIGKNTISIHVTSINRNVSQTYSITVTRGATVVSTSDNTLSSLSITQGSLTTPFSSDVPTYRSIISTPYTTVNIIPTATDSTAIIKVKVNTGSFSIVASGTPSSDLPLGLGENTITIRVSHGISSQTYSISARRQQFAYVGNRNANKVYVCPIENDGSLGICAIATSALGIVYGMDVHPLRPTLYIARALEGFINNCTINPDGSLTSCTTMTDPLLTDARYVRVTSSGNRMYVTNGAGDNVIVCTLDSNETLSNCAVAGSGFSQPFGFDLNQNETIAYVGNFNTNTISICPINIDGTFGICTMASDTSFDNPVGIRLDHAGTMLYVISYANDTVSMCPVNPDGSLSTCASNTGTSAPLSIRLNADDSFAYITEIFNEDIVYCPIISQTLGTCASTQNIGGFPSDIFLY